MNKQTSLKILWVLSLVVLFSAVAVFVWKSKPAGKRNGISAYLRAPGASEKNLFQDDFQKRETIEETNKMSGSANSDWWVNSGGLLNMSAGTAGTIQGDLPEDSKWAKKYASSNPEDSDEGAHPQNIFRLVTKDKWQNLIQQAYFRINKMNLSESENRNESNGVLLFNRYEDGDNLYYTGLRVDGSAVIKKKYEGEYYTLVEKLVFPGEKYDRDENPNLLPLGKWIGIRSELSNTNDGDVEIKLYVDENRSGEWKLAASVRDDGRKKYGENILSDQGHGGIRTDFMDVEFADYTISEVK